LTAAASPWLLWQLADSAFPIGGFAHSGGLEAAAQSGELATPEALADFVRDSLWQSGNGSLPLVRAVHLDPTQLAALDALCEAFLTSAVANRASRTQGRALLSTAERVFADALPVALRSESRHRHYAPLFGAILAALGIPVEDTLRLFLFLTQRGLLSAAVRLSLLGPQQAQRLQLELGPLLEQIYRQCGALPLAALAQTAPIVELFQATHDRLYSRLFVS
jgi:urease accessory protein